MLFLCHVFSSVVSSVVTFYEFERLVIPRFSIFANLCRSAGFFLQGSLKIVALNIFKIFTEVCRFSLKILAEICFSAASKEPIYCMFGLLQLLYGAF